MVYDLTQTHMFHMNSCPFPSVVSRSGFFPLFDRPDHMSSLTFPPVLPSSPLSTVPFY